MQLLALDVILFDSGVPRWGRRKVEDNDVMAIVPAGLVHQAQLVKVVGKAIRKLGEVASGIEKILWDEIRPLENWGLHLYFAFRSESEMAEFKDPRWG